MTEEELKAKLTSKFTDVIDEMLWSDLVFDTFKEGLFNTISDGLDVHIEVNDDGKPILSIWMQLLDFDAHIPISLDNIRYGAIEELIERGGDADVPDIQSTIAGLEELIRMLRSTKVELEARLVALSPESGRPTEADRP